VSPDDSSHSKESPGFVFQEVKSNLVCKESIILHNKHNFSSKQWRLMLVICISRMKIMYIRISTPTRIRTRTQTNLESYSNRHHTAKFVASLAALASNYYIASPVYIERFIHLAWSSGSGPRSGACTAFCSRQSFFSITCLGGSDIRITKLPHEASTLAKTLLMWSTSAEA
jgi:hypothetical protein